MRSAGLEVDTELAGARRALDELIDSQGRLRAIRIASWPLRLGAAGGSQTGSETRPGAPEGEDDSAESVAFLPPSGEPDVVLANLRTIFVNR